MEETLQELASQLILSRSLTDKSKCEIFPKYFIGLAGIPGSGKSTISKRVIDLINQETTKCGNGIRATVLPMDGFHYPRSFLDKMQDPVEAHKRRGAPWTFDAIGLLNTINYIKQKDEGFAPSFDHAVKDPAENSIKIEKFHKVIIIEGNYILSNTSPWDQIGTLLDEKWYIDIDLNKAMERVALRHVAAGICNNLADGYARVEYNDKPNAIFIESTKINATRIITSIDFRTK